MESPISSLDLIEVGPNGASMPIHVEVGCPHPNDFGSWSCAIRIGGPESNVRDVYGEDSLQALCLALRIIYADLAQVLKRGGRLICSDDGSEYSLESYFPNFSDGKEKSSE